MNTTWRLRTPQATPPLGILYSVRLHRIFAVLTLPFDVSCIGTEVIVVGRVRSDEAIELLVTALVDIEIRRVRRVREELDCRTRE